MNLKVILFSIAALGFVALAFWIDWLFLIGAILIMFVNQKLLFPRKSKDI